MPHHAVADDNHFFKPGKDLADLFGGEPAHIAFERHERLIEADASAAGKGLEEILSRLAERRKRSVKIQRGDIAVRMISPFVSLEGVDDIWVAVAAVLWRRENQGGLIGVLRFEVAEEGSPRFGVLA
jgi:hypothetical protein